MECSICGAPLTSSIETYGEIEHPVCASCWLERSEPGFPHMYTCTHHPDGSVSCAMTPEWKALEDALEAIR